MPAPPRILVCFAAAILSAAPSFCADLSGVWTGPMLDRNGDTHDLSFRLAEKGGTLTGKMYGDNESSPIENASISGNQITFTVTSELNGDISKFVYTGTVNGDEIELTRKRANQKPNPAKDKAEPAKAEPKDPAARAAQNQRIRLKRIA